MTRTPILMLAAVLCSAPSQAAPVTYEPPPETAQLAPAAGVEIAEANCSACHSVDYITTQPRGHKDPVAFWGAAVQKMRRAYGMELADEDAKHIVRYLAEAYP